MIDPASKIALVLSKKFDVKKDNTLKMEYENYAKNSQALFQQAQDKEQFYRIKEPDLNQRMISFLLLFRIFEIIKLIEIITYLMSTLTFSTFHQILEDNQIAALEIA